MELTLLKWIFFLLSLGTVVYLGFRKPSILISLLAGAVALEISTTWFPPLGTLGSQLDSLARLVTVGMIGAALWRLWIEPEKRLKLKSVLTHYLTIALMIYIAVGGFSILYSVDRGKTAVEIIRLLTLFLLYLSICLLAEKKHIFLPFKVVHWVGVALVPLALYEGMTRHFIWQEHLAEGMIARVNTTFVDPNIFARYLILGIVANLILQYMNTETGKRIVYIVSLLGLMGALAITLSRSGILTLAIVLALMVLLIPRKRMLLPIGFLGFIGVIIIAMRPTIWQRLLTFREGFGALDAQRQYLWKAAWAMFTDHRLLGVGLGGFQEMFLTKYIHLKTVIPDAEGATLSHTTILTIAAELGLIGLAALSWVWIAIIRVLGSLRKLGLEPKGLEGYIPGVGYFLWITTVFISSQAEARFFEDPMIWISMGLLVRLLGQSTEDNQYKQRDRGLSISN
ncbi:O-antigen ligase [Desulfosporosinus sp.]|uniref:O-antigen ligase family protein n=1 Tax=Desulfosporosinus sp. TaxID=157907 RepID=UPI0025B97F39|nr:O-antigen ligase family protein [Desulfosporosinus sp.]MBC2721498.1 O-antigen ligase family protein [Desulfosporosinus sp.]MBC2726373.1 O-antigen ligase family protein [Desulfosporosinus sp.]